jgi:hypothetical protein
MDGAPAFAFQSASTPDELMDELEKFIVFWVGPWRKEYGEPESALKKVQLPGPLRRLYGFAGRWTRPHPDVAEDAGIFSIQEHLRPLAGLKHSPDGKLVFLDENQGNWTFATLPEGDDPPVWVEDVFDGYNQGKWGLVSRSLSRFLVTFCLQELLFGSRLCLHDEHLDRLFESSRSDSIPLWINGPYAYQDGREFHLLHQSVLVGPHRHRPWFAANHEAGVRFLTAHQGEIKAVSLGTPSSWSLRIQPNGSAELALPGWSDCHARVPAGTFDFASVRDRLLEVCSEGLERSRPWYVCFPRSGQTSCRGKGVTNVRLVRTLFRRALGAVESKEAKFDELLRRFPPPL